MSWSRALFDGTGFGDGTTNDAGAEVQCGAPGVAGILEGRPAAGAASVALAPGAAGFELADDAAETAGSLSSALASCHHSDQSLREPSPPVHHSLEDLEPRQYFLDLLREALLLSLVALLSLLSLSSRCLLPSDLRDDEGLREADLCCRQLGPPRSCQSMPSLPPPLMSSQLTHSDKGQWAERKQIRIL